MASPLATPLPWNLVAPAYAEEIRPQFERYAREALRLAAAPQGSRIVDVACGPGTLAALAAADGLLVDAIDFSPQMIAQLEQRKLARVTAHVADGQALPFADASFAAGFSMFGLMFFPERAQGFAELRRVLRPGARAVVSSWLPQDQVPVLNAMFAALREAMPESAPKQGTAELPLIDPAKCREEMSRSFAEVEVHRVEHGVRFDSPRAWWDAAQRTMAPLLLMRKAAGEERWRAIGAKATEGIERVIGPGAFDLVMPAWLTVGVAR